MIENFALKFPDARDAIDVDLNQNVETDECPASINSLSVPEVKRWCLIIQWKADLILLRGVRLLLLGQLL